MRKLLLSAIFILSVCCQDKQPAAASPVPDDVITDDNDVQPVPKKYLIGTYQFAGDSLFQLIPTAMTGDKKLYLRKEATEAFSRMYKAALDSGIRLTALSATRNFDDQKRIWQNKWEGRIILEDGTDASSISDHAARAKKIMQYSSMPGTSRHHWGTDLDIVSLDPEFFEKPQGKRIYQWLTRHAKEFGFCQTYTDKSIEERKGYEEEKWHWSYYPTASEFLKSYLANISYADLPEFPGRNVAAAVKAIEDYVAGINPECK